MLHLFPGVQSAVTRQYPPNLHIGRGEKSCEGSEVGMLQIGSAMRLGIAVG
jgi:hypothetical protein